MRKFISQILFLGAVVLCSCFGEEPLNSECDIETASVHVDSPNDIFHHLYDTLKIVDFH